MLLQPFDCRSWPVQPSRGAEASKGTVSGWVGIIACPSLSPVAAAGAKESSGMKQGMFFLSELYVVAMSPPELLTSKSFGFGTDLGSFRALEECLLKFDFLALPYGDRFALGFAYIAADL